MEARIYFGNLGHSNTIKERVAIETDKLELGLKISAPSTIQVWLNNNNPIQSAGPPEYSCSLLLKLRGKRYYVSKKGEDFYVCFYSAFHDKKKKIKQHKKLVISHRNITIEKKYDLAN